MSLIPGPASSDIQPGGKTRGTQNNFDHEGLRARRRQPPDDLQLALEREDRIRADCRRIGADLRRHAVARSERRSSSGRTVDVAG